jgi:hypothetical protein
MAQTEQVGSEVLSTSGPVGPPTTPPTRPTRPTRRCRSPSCGKPRWVIMQTGYRSRDGSAYGYGTSSAGPTRRLMAVCRSETGAKKWLRRLRRWAEEDAGRPDQSRLIPTYETLKASGIDGLAGPEPAQFVGPAYYGEHGRAASLRLIILGVRESHTALRQAARRRRETGD